MRDVTPGQIGAGRQASAPLYSSTFRVWVRVLGRSFPCWSIRPPATRDYPRMMLKAQAYAPSRAREASANLLAFLASTGERSDRVAQNKR